MVRVVSIKTNLARVRQNARHNWRLIAPARQRYKSRATQAILLNCFLNLGAPLKNFEPRERSMAPKTMPALKARFTSKNQFVFGVEKSSIGLKRPSACGHR